MARRVVDTVDYFPHDAKSGKTIAILEGKWGLVGYAFWFKLLESICQTNGHCLDFNDVEIWQYFISYAKVDEETAEHILDLLAKLDNIDSELWHETRQVWCQALVDNVKEVYTNNRHRPVPSKPVLSVRVIDGDDDISGVIQDRGEITGTESTQSKVKERKVDIMSGKPDVKPIFDYLNQRTGRRYRPTSANSAHAVARMKDGHTLDDFKAVIDGRVKAWGGDPKMAEYLRPETLFGTKFDSYLATAFAPATVSSGTDGWECPTCHKVNTHTGGMCVYCKGARDG